MRDFVLFMYELAMKKEIGFEIIVEDNSPIMTLKQKKINGMLSLYSMVMTKIIRLMPMYVIS